MTEKIDIEWTKNLMNDKDFAMLKVLQNATLFDKLCRDSGNEEVLCDDCNKKYKRKNMDKHQKSKTHIKNIKTVEN
jgi:redox-regulated HSP33 family molecular chaperone